MIIPGTTNATVIKRQFQLYRSEMKWSNIIPFRTFVRKYNPNYNG